MAELNIQVPQPEVKAFGVVRDKDGNIKGTIPSEIQHLYDENGKLKPKE